MANYSTNLYCLVTFEQLAVSRYMQVKWPGVDSGDQYRRLVVPTWVTSSAYMYFYQQYCEQSTKMTS